VICVCALTPVVSVFRRSNWTDPFTAADIVRFGSVYVSEALSVSSPPVVTKGTRPEVSPLAVREVAERVEAQVTAPAALIENNDEESKLVTCMARTFDPPSLSAHTSAGSEPTTVS
jgi:hypothetical protein